MKRANPDDAWIDPTNDPGTIPRIYGAGNYEFLKIHIDGPFAFVLVSVTSAVLFTFYRFLPAMDYGMSLIFQLVLITWFALDLRRLDRILGSDEASQGVIYVYIDAVLAVGYVAMVAAAIGVMVFFIAGFVMSAPAAKGISGGCAGCGCGGCTNCCEWNCEDYQALFSDSKCLFFNEEGSSFECCESSTDEMPTIADLRERRSDLDQGMERV
ncbi:hypothetical protein P3T76_000762 [Phytophthora citrophthora]|uniref:Uncharacterized protein n=1 Tax=Phytophthora citrophthora TaxID=4793 RepID=A0AAD9LT21_9STRA|nr:hypothetical protein P3T76_000762 [Phytophthora citrophthora]